MQSPSFVKLGCLCGVALGLGIAVACAVSPSAKNPAQERALAAHVCYLGALEPVLGELAEPVLQAILAGGNPVTILVAHRLSSADVLATATRWRACDEAQVSDPPLENS